MNATLLTFKNLGRNKRRTLLTLLAIALPLFVFTIARSLKDVVADFLAATDRNMRVAVHQKITFTTYLPQRMRAEIEDMAPEGYIDAICRTSWFGGRVEGKQSSFVSMAVDRDTFARVYSEFHMTPEQQQRFLDERRAAVVAQSLANQMNWKENDRIELIGSLPPYPKIEFIVAAVVKDISGPWLYFALDYYDEIIQKESGNPAGIHNFWLKCSSPQARQWALSEIDKRYANTEFETRTEMESTFLEAFTRSGGDWVGMAWTVGQLTVLVAIMAAFNTMSMAFRERTRELAVMRALGFSATRVVGMVLSEGLLLGLVGGLIAVGPLYLALRLWQPDIPELPGGIRISDNTALLAMAVALACGVLAALVPAFLAGRLKVAAALRKVV